MNDDTIREQPGNGRKKKNGKNRGVVIAQILSGVSVVICLAAVAVIYMMLSGTAAGEEQTAAAAEQEDPAAQAEDTDAEIEPVHIVLGCENAADSPAGTLAVYFADAAEQASEGAVTAEVAPLETGDALDACSRGDADMVIFERTEYSDTLPVLCSIPDTVPGQAQNVCDYFASILADEQAYEALQNEAGEHGLLLLAGTAGGSNWFLADFSFSGLMDLIEQADSFGAADPAWFYNFGFAAEDPTAAQDVYSAMQSGQLDSAWLNCRSAYDPALYDLAGCWMPDGTYSLGDIIAVNADWWNSLSQAQRDAVRTVCDAACRYSAEYSEDEAAALAEELAAHGAGQTEMTRDESDGWWFYTLDYSYDTICTAAWDNGIGDAVQPVLDAAASCISDIASASLYPGTADR